MTTIYVTRPDLTDAEEVANMRDFFAARRAADPAAAALAIIAAAKAQPAPQATSIMDRRTGMERRGALPSDGEFLRDADRRHSGHDRRRFTGESMTGFGTFA